MIKVKFSIAHHFILGDSVVGADVVKVGVTLLRGHCSVPDLVVSFAILPCHRDIVTLLLPFVFLDCHISVKSSQDKLTMH